MWRAFLSGLRFEARLLRRDAAVIAALLALAALTLFALGEGAARVSAQRGLVDAARAEEAQRLSGLRKLLTRLEQNDASASQGELPPYRDPRNAAFMGAGPAAATAALGAAPLALIASGQSDLLPPAIKVTTGAKDSFLFADEIDNPANLLAGATDLAFVVALAFPLVVLGFCFNLIAGEREQGALALTLAYARFPQAALAGKFTARCAAPLATMLLATAVGVAYFAGAPALAAPAFAMLAALIVVYGLFWAALAAAVDGLGRSAAFNALTLIGAFALLAMVAPAAVNSLSSAVHPAPSRMDMVLAARAASTDADKARDAALARYVEEHGGDAQMQRGGARERTLRRLATQEAAFARVEAVIAAHDAQLARQRALAARLAFLSPPLLAYDALAQIAGAGEGRYRAFLERLAAFHAEWRDFFLSRARAERPMTLADYDALPRFSAVIDAPADIGAALLGVALPALALALFALRGFRRARI